MPKARFQFLNKQTKSIEYVIHQAHNIFIIIRFYQKAEFGHFSNSTKNIFMSKSFENTFTKIEPCL